MLPSFPYLHENNFSEEIAIFKRNVKKSLQLKSVDFFQVHLIQEMDAHTGTNAVIGSFITFSPRGYVFGR